MEILCWDVSISALIVSTLIGFLMMQLKHGSSFNYPESSSITPTDKC